MSTERTPITRKPRVRRWTAEDIPQLVVLHRRVYRDFPEEEQQDERLFEMQLAAFPEGQFLIEHQGKVIGYASSLIVQLDDDNIYKYAEVTGNGTFATHDPSGDTLYGADIGIDPDYRGQGLVHLLYEQRRKLLKRYNLRRMVAYGRIPGFQEYEGKLTAQEYVEEVVAGRLKDPALNAHLRAGYRVRRVLIDFVRDQSSLHYATFLEMPNPDFSPERRKVAAAPLKRPLRRMRVCAAQWRMRDISSFEEFDRIVEFFVDSADSYHCHFLLFPELFTVNLFSMFAKDLSDRDAIERLADLSEQYIEMMKKKAQEHDLYIVGGSHPTRRGGKLYNVSYLFTPSGGVYTQDKLHITPSERHFFGIQPGESLRIFDTPFGKIAIQVCYDIEFPEASRLLALHGVEVIFVPFSTDEKKAYNRVRFTSHARAVENYVYVVIAGNVGNLPEVQSYLINYGQAAILTPSDIAFPMGGIEGEADPNNDTVVIADLDLNTLEMQREIGSVRPLYDRRPDLYELRARIPIEFVKIE